jgi:hypothetical protein
MYSIVKNGSKTEKEGHVLHLVIARLGAEAEAEAEAEVPSSEFHRILSDRK